MLKEILRNELKNRKYWQMSPAEIVNYLNGHSQTVEKYTTNKNFSVEPGAILSLAGIGPDVINRVLGVRKASGYLKAFLNKPIKYEEFDYWIGVIDWIATTKPAWYGGKKLLTSEQCTALKQAFTDAIIAHGGSKTIIGKGPERIRILTNGAVAAITVDDLKGL